MNELRPCPCDEPEDDVKEVLAAEAIATQVPTRVRKARIRIPWSEERLLCLLETAMSLEYPTICFMGQNLRYGLKVEAMRLIQESLARDRTLWPGAPIAETLDQWLDEAVKRHMERRGRKGTKAILGKVMIDPLKDEVAAMYTLPEIEDEVAAYVHVGVNKQEELLHASEKNAEKAAITKNMLDRSMDLVKSRMQSGKRESTDASSTTSRKN